MKHKFFVGLPYQKIHSKFVHDLIGGEYISHECSVEEKNFPEKILAHDGRDVIWFFNDIYFDLHPRLKGKQVLLGHGLGLGWFLTPRRVEIVNRHFDLLFDTGRTPRRWDIEKIGVAPEKVRQVGYTLLFEIPDVPAEKGRVLFSSVYFKGWNHHENLIRILRNLDPSLHGSLTVHPLTPEPLRRKLWNICGEKKNVQAVTSQEELLGEYAKCECVVGQITSSITPFYFLKKPAILLRGRVGRNPFKGLGWSRICREVDDPVYHNILRESTRISRWRQFGPKLVSHAKVSESALQLFYPSNFSREETAAKIRQYLKEIEG